MRAKTLAVWVVGMLVLGKDYALLTPGETSKGQAGLRYHSPSAQWRQYNTIIIDPVTFRGDETRKISAEDQHALATLDLFAARAAANLHALTSGAATAAQLPLQ